MVWEDSGVLNSTKSASQRAIIQTLEYSNVRKTRRRKVGALDPGESEV